MNDKTLNIVDVKYEADGSSTQVDSYGMREMQKRAYAKRNSQHLLIKAPPASGKSRALMFLAPPLAQIALKFGPYEYFAIAVFSLTLIASLSGKSMVKGLMAALIGMSAMPAVAFAGKEREQGA